MNDYISKAQVLETYAELYDVFDDNPKIREILHAVYEKINGLKEHSEIIRCKDCRWWVPGHITDKDDFIPPKCGKYQQMVGHSYADYCSLGERKESEKNV